MSTIRPRQVPVWASLLVFMVMSLGALALLDTNPRSLAFAWVFPYGLWFALSMALGSPQSEALSTTLLVSSFAVYVVMLVAVVRARTWVRLAVACLVLACLLLLNVAGCQMMAGGLSRIGQ